MYCRLVISTHFYNNIIECHSGLLFHIIDYAYPDLPLEHENKTEYCTVKVNDVWWDVLCAIYVEKGWTYLTEASGCLVGQSA